MTSGGDPRPPTAPKGVADWHAGSGRERSKGFAGQNLILKRVFGRPWFGLVGGLGDLAIALQVA